MITTATRALFCPYISAHTHIYIHNYTTTTIAHIIQHKYTYLHSYYTATTIAHIIQHKYTYLHSYYTTTTIPQEKHYNALLIHLGHFGQRLTVNLDI